MARPPDIPFSDDAFEDISAVISSGKPLDVALGVLMGRTCDLLEVQQANLFLAEAPGTSLRLAASSSALPAQPVLLAPGVGVEGWVMRRGRRLAVVNPAADKRFAAAPRWSGELPPDAIQAIAAVPVRSGSNVVGVLSVIDLAQLEPNAPSGHPLSTASIAELLPFLAVLADLIGLALENSDILQRQERRTQLIQLLHTIAAIPTSESTEALAHTITDQLCTITHAEIASIFLQSAATDELIAFGSSDTPLGRLQHEHGLDHIPLATSGPLLQVLQNDAPLLVGNATNLATLPIGSVADIQSVLIVPLRIEQTCEGLVMLATTKAEAFTEDDLSFLTFISVRLSYAMHHDKLADELIVAEQARIHQDTRESFIAVVAHDLKNALTTISGSSQLALRKAARGDTNYSQKALAVVGLKAAQALQLVNDMVDINNVDAGRFRLFIAPTNLVTLLEEEVEAAQGLSTQHQIEFHTTIAAAEVAADERRLRQVIDNLLTNAIRYSANGGAITVQLTNVPANLLVSDTSDQQALAQKVLITVSDQGMGIAAEDLPHIFDRFYRGRGERIATGSGLGLYIASEIIMQHGGNLWVESAQGSGASFYITLPVSRRTELIASAGEDQCA
jgi:signal transduction histidine kinase